MNTSVIPTSEESPGAWSQSTTGSGTVYPDVLTNVTEIQTKRTLFIWPQRYVDALNDATALKLIVPIIYVAIMMAVGIIGNIIVIYVYGCRWHRATTKIFVTTLALLDLVNCLITMPTEMLVLRNFYYLDAPVFCRLSRFSTFWMNNNSAVVLLIISIDRFIKICLPNRVSFSYRGAKIACIVAVLIGLAVSWPGLVIYGRQTHEIIKLGGKMRFVMCNVDDSMSGTWYPKGYYIYLWVGFLSTAVAMVILYTLVGMQIWLRKIRKDKRTDSFRSASFKFSTEEGRKIYKGKMEGAVQLSFKSSSDQSSGTEMSEDVFRSNDSNETPHPQRTKRLPTLASIKISRHGLQAGKATLMLAIITIVYIVSFLPFLVITMTREVKGELWYPSLSDAEKVAVNLFLRSYLVSNTVNPIIYGFCNVQFRRECARLVRRMACRKM